MSKIIVQEGTFWRVYRNKFMVNPKLLEKDKEKPLEFFSNPANEYIFNIPNTVHSVASIQPGTFFKLGIKGKIVINTPCSFDWDIRNSNNKEELISEMGSSWYSCIDHIEADEITINATNPSNGTVSFRFSDWDENGKPCNLKKININSPEAKIDISGASNLEEINLTCKELYEFKIGNDCKKLKRIYLPNLTHLMSNWNSLDIFSCEVPNNCMITLNKNCKFTVEGNINSASSRINKNVALAGIRLNSFVNSETAKSYSETETTFTISYNELRMLIEREWIRKFKTSITTAEANNEKEISEFDINGKPKKHIEIEDQEDQLEENLER